MGKRKDKIMSGRPVVIKDFTGPDNLKKKLIGRVGWVVKVNYENVFPVVAKFPDLGESAVRSFQFHQVRAVKI